MGEFSNYINELNEDLRKNPAVKSCTKPLVSVIVPAFNAEETIAKCLQSILKQSFKNIEIITVNDGSNDNTPSLISLFAKYDSRVKLINQENKGLYAAREAGFETAQGKYILYVDSDDYIDKFLIEKSVNKIKEVNADVVIFGAFTVKNEKIFKGTYSINKIPAEYKEKFLTRKDYENNLFQFFPTAWCKLYRKDFLVRNNIKFQPLRDGEDQLFYIHTMLTAERICILDENLYYYTKNRKGSITFGSKKSVSPVLNFFASEKLSETLNLKEKFITQLINKFFSKSLSWYGRCDKNFKNEFYQKLKEFKNYLDKHYPAGWWKYYRLSKFDNYFLIKLKIFAAKIICKILRKDSTC